ncbi:hypothetical protein BGZ57DRAFT_32008 [Hyaloscypha finlandica]|nr:hypothetical protein BGZ57DRAFT_32008 [Hyaloscypha finlandica]
MLSKNSCCAGSFNGDTETLTWPMSLFLILALILSFYERTSCLQQAKTVLGGEISYSKFPFLSCRSRTRESVALSRLHHTLLCMQAASTSDITFRMLRGSVPQHFPNRPGSERKRRRAKSLAHQKRGSGSQSGVRQSGDACILTPPPCPDSPFLTPVAEVNKPNQTT